MTSEEIKLKWKETRSFYKVIIVFIDNNKKNENMIMITFYEVKSPGWMPHANAHMTVERYAFQYKNVVITLGVNWDLQLNLVKTIKTKTIKTPPDIGNPSRFFGYPV